MCLLRTHLERFIQEAVVVNECWLGGVAHHPLEELQELAHTFVRVEKFRRVDVLKEVFYGGLLLLGGRYWGGVSLLEWPVGFALLAEFGSAENLRH